MNKKKKVVLKIHRKKKDKAKAKIKASRLLKKEKV
jgi:hypothetical protein